MIVALGYALYRALHQARSTQWGACVERIAIEKKRNVRGTFCEFFSHFVLLFVLVRGYSLSVSRSHSNKVYDEVVMTVPMNATGSAISKLLHGPLMVPTFDNYAQIGSSLGDELEENFHALKSVYGQSIDILLHRRVIHYAPRGPLVSDFLMYMNATYTSFANFQHIVHDSEEEAVKAIVAQKLKPFALLVLQDMTPGRVSYTIRQDFSALPNTNQISLSPARGLNNGYTKYLISGFMTLKKSVDIWAFNTTGASGSAVDARCRRPPETVLTPFPTYEYTQNPFYTTVGFLLGLTMIMSTMYPMSKLAKSIVEEKELRMRELMKIMGLRDWAHQLSWFLSALVLFLWIAATMTVVATSSFIPASNPGLIFLLFLLFALSEITLSFLVSVFFSNSKLAAIAAPVVLFAAMLPRYIFYGVPDSALVGSKLMACLLSPAAFVFAADFVSQYEYAGQGIQLNNLSEGEFNFCTCLVMLAVDFCLYGFLAWYCDQVIPQEHGTPRHPLFVFCTKYWLPGCADPTANGKGPDFEDMEEFRDVHQNDHIEYLPREMLPLGTVRIKNLAKTYPDGKVAVRKVSLTMLEGQITCLLGHNGAGKSTTISCLTGMTEATSGDVSINGLLLGQDLQAIRQLTGLCPQHNVLYPHLTVREHLRFFGVLKGLHGSSLRQRVEYIIEEVGLTEKRDVRSHALSGGMKRKLCLGMALVGDPKFVLLDEPTSGMDPYSRRSMWTLLQKHKTGRVILLTTHFMDEADTLADRIAIMSEGVLLCSGSSLFLKNRFGAGYLLSCSKISSTAPADVIVAEVRAIIPSATLLSAVAGEVIVQMPLTSSPFFPQLFRVLEERRHAIGVKSFGISITTLEQVFISLAHVQDPMALGAKPTSAKLAWTRNPLTDSAVLPVHLADPAPHGGGDNVADATPLIASHAYHGVHSSPKAFAAATRVCLSGKVHTWTMLRELYHKRLIITRRDWKGLFFQIVLPALQILLVLLLLNVNFNPAGHSIALDGDMFRVYGNIADASLVVANAYSSPYSADIRGGFIRRDLPSHTDSGLWNSTTVSRYLLNQSQFVDHRFGAIVARDVVPADVTVDWVWTRAYLSSVDNLGDSTNAFLLSTFGNQYHYIIDSSNFLPAQSSASSIVLDPTGLTITIASPVPGFPPITQTTPWGDVTYETIEPFLPTDTERYHLTFPSNHTAMHNSTSPHAAAAWHGQLTKSAFQTCMANPGAEYITKNHPLPISTDQGLEIRTVLSMLTSVFMLIPLCYIPAAFVSFLVKERECKSKHLQQASGVPPYLYWVATYLWDISLFTVLAGFIITAFYIVGKSSSSVFVGSAESILAVLVLVMSYGASAIPLNYLYSFAFSNYSTAQISITLINFMTGFVLVLAHYVMNFVPQTRPLAMVSVHLFRFFPAYNIGEGLINLSTSYLQATVLGGVSHPFAWVVCGRSMVFMAVEAVGYMAAVLMSESRRVKRYLGVVEARRSQRFGPPPPPKNGKDDDVLREEKEVRRLAEALRYPLSANMRGSGHDDMPVDIESSAEPLSSLALLVDGLIKTYVGMDPWSKPKYAVRGLSLACRDGERFGLLGINGAGKTTTLSILTGELDLTSGSVLIGGRPLSDGLTQRMLGYCPQVDPLLDLMTGYETLRFFGRIRGLDEALLEKRVQALVLQTGLQPHAHRPCGTYSGGNKRKLSLAVALIGDPKVLLLDEPSTGMDPEARRHMWDVIEQVSAQRTVVLVSHSMEEIEALCTRVGVMVSGRMQCLGSVQHLKSRFGGAYTVELRCAVDRVEECLRLCRDALPDCVVEEQHGGFFRLRVDRDIDLAGIFALLEGGKATLGIHDYSVSQCSLEQVFIKFAKEQEEEPSAREEDEDEDEDEDPLAQASSPLLSTPTSVVEMRRREPAPIDPLQWT